MLNYSHMGLFFREKPVAATEQAEGTVDFNRLLEVASGDLQVDIETLRGGILMNGGSFTPEDQKIVARLTGELETTARARSMPSDSAAIEAALRLHLMSN